MFTWLTKLWTEFWHLTSFLYRAVKAIKANPALAPLLAQAENALKSLTKIDVENLLNDFAPDSPLAKLGDTLKATETWANTPYDTPATPILATPNAAEAFASAKTLPPANSDVYNAAKKMDAPVTMSVPPNSGTIAPSTMPSATTPATE